MKTLKLSLVNDSNHWLKIKRERSEEELSSARYSDVKEVVVAYVPHESQEDAAEVVKRWNAYPELVAFGARRATEVATLRGADIHPDAPKPYTVVVRYEVNDDPGAGSGNVYFLHVELDGPEDKESLDGAIDDLIAECHDIDKGDEDRTEQVDSYRPDYRCIAIYEGHLTNLVK